jgi:hypothetical protein
MSAPIEAAYNPFFKAFLVGGHLDAPLLGFYQGQFFAFLYPAFKESGVLASFAAKKEEEPAKTPPLNEISLRSVLRT